MFYTAWEPLTLVCRNANKMLLLNRAMEERFKTRTWMTPLPQQGRIPHFPRCACCFARFVLENAAAHAHAEAPPAAGLM